MKNYMIVALALAFVVALPSCKGCKKQKPEEVKTEMPAPMPTTPEVKPVEATPAPAVTPAPAAMPAPK